MQSPFLTTKELAARWHCTGWTVSTRYRALGLKPLKFGKSLLFPLNQVEEVERHLGGVVDVKSREVA